MNTPPVSLVHYTPYGDNLIVRMARVSSPSNQDNLETAPKLINYLIKHSHWSPFEMVNMCVQIETTRSIAAQIIRHRSFSFQEFSQRYAEVLDKPKVPKLRRQDTKNRQNSIDDLDSTNTMLFNRYIANHYDQAMAIYNDMLRAGIAKECAREVLPMGTKTTLYMNGSVRSWLHYCDLRCGNGTQLEHRLIAEGCKELIKRCFPKVYEAKWGA